MSKTGRFSLDIARTIAEHFVAHIGPSCHRVEIKGSICRGKRVVGDVEVLAIPKIEERPLHGAQSSLFGKPAVEQRSALWDSINGLAAQGRVKVLKPEPNVDISVATSLPGEFVEVAEGVFASVDPRWDEKKDGSSKYWKVWLAKPKIQVDLFMVTHETWGVQSAIRTGPALFSKDLVTRWRDSKPGRSVKNGRVYESGNKLADTPEEKDVFEAMGIVWVAPGDRKDGSDIVPRFDRPDRTEQYLDPRSQS